MIVIPGCHLTPRSCRRLKEIVMPPLAQSPVRAANPGGTQQRNLPRVRSRDLLRDSNLIMIEHDGDLYYLRMTRNNKLILTK
jgi:hemin uptake protein HemP